MRKFFVLIFSSLLFMNSAYSLDLNIQNPSDEYLKKQITMLEVVDNSVLSQKERKLLSRYSLGIEGAAFTEMEREEVLVMLRDPIGAIKQSCDCTVKTDYSRHSRQLKEKSMKALIARELKNKSECSVCKFTVEIKRADRIPDNFLSYKIIWNQYPLSGKKNFTFHNKEKKSFNLLAQIKAEVPALKITKNIVMGEPLDKDSLEKVMQTVHVTTRQFAKSSDLLGSEAKRSLSEGQVLFLSDLRKKMTARVGERVRAFKEHSSVYGEMTAIVRGNGRVGDIIPIYLPRTKKRTMAEVVGPGKVKLR